MRIIVGGFACLLIAVAPGCSVHPLPGDITRDTTFAIIHNIRCEARAEVKDHLQALLLRSPSVIVQSIDPEDALENLEKIRVHDPESASTIKRYSLSAIAYLFTFDITENDDATNGSAHFALPWNHGKFTLDLTGELTKERIGSRKIGVVETFEELDQLDCSEASQQRRNLVYPITGSIGMAETVDSFFRLAESVGDNKKFSDTLTYTTTINATADPTLELKEVPHHFRLTKASVNFLARREDKHMAVVALTFPVTTETTTKTREFVDPRALSMRRADEDLGEIVSETKKKAAEEVCIQQALIQEQITGVIRSDPPERYCRNDLRRY